MSAPDDWYLMSRHGAVLFFIASRPGCTIGEMAEGFGRTQRTIWSVVMDLQRAGMLQIQRQGRRHHYRINPDARFELPSAGEFPLRVLVGTLANQALRQDEVALPGA
jgi:DNA-binding MarR family transcriptional regulator